MSIENSTHKDLMDWFEKTNSGKPTPYTATAIKDELMYRLEKKSKKNEALEKAAKEVISYTEIAHRPPVRDEIESGKMVLVRLHALASLNDAVNL